MELWTGMLYALLAGAMIPLGGCLASVDFLLPNWGKTEVYHTVMSFGGGALFSAVALVLVPEGVENVSITLAVVSFLAGGYGFYLLDLFLDWMGGSFSQMVAMVSDFIPEAIALGATLTVGNHSAVLIALMIGLQNFPEGFNAYRELVDKGGLSSRRVLTIFCLLSLLGPLAAYIGVTVFASHHTWLGCLMLFAGGGILYITFVDIAPEAVLQNRRWSSLGCIAGFTLGLIGYMVTGAG